MPDPKKFKPYYIVAAYSSKTGKIRELRLSTEMGRMDKLTSLDTAKTRAREFTNSLNETKTLGTSDWEPMIHFQYTEQKNLPISLK